MEHWQLISIVIFDVLLLSIRRARVGSARAGMMLHRHLWWLPVHHRLQLLLLMLRHCNCSTHARHVGSAIKTAETCLMKDCGEHTYTTDEHTNWVPESNLAGNVRVGVLSGFGQILPQKPFGTMGLVLKCKLHQTSAPQTNSNATSWHHANPARLPSGTKPKALSRCDQDRQHTQVGI